MGTDEIIVSQAHKLRKLLPQLAATIKEKRKSDISQQLAESQKLRRADLQALKDAIKPAKVSRLVEKKDAYLLLNELLKKHKDAQSSGLEKTNGVIKSLLTKLASEEYAQAVETLRVDEYVQNLQESHQKTYQLYLSRQQEELVKSSSNKKEIRETMNKSYRLFCSHLENLVDYDEDTSYSSLYTLVEKVKKDFAEVLQRRKAQAKRKKPIQSEEEVVPPSD
ncbi:MAG: hypothetical protein IPK55_02745 [Streptococcus sp.]|nr:hypothetical protein [Streptococcus sp.]